MTATKSRKARHDPSDEITARPKSRLEEIRSRPTPENGLSVDSDDLGLHTLADATEQSNFESGTVEPELSIVDGADTDEPMVGPNFDPDASLWEQEIDQSLADGSLEMPRRHR